MKKICVVCVGFASLISGNLYAQDSTRSVNFSGFIDGYYRFTPSENGSTNNYTSFTNTQNSFAFNMASLRADITAFNNKVAGTIDLGVGTRAKEFSYNESGVEQTIKQAYISYIPNDKVKLTAGKFATHVGYELVDAPLNKNYSMSYMFTNGPFFHTGVKADFTLGKVGLMVGVANYTDQLISTTSTRTALAQLSTKTADAKFSFYLNYVGFFGSENGKNPSGQKSVNQLDLVVLGSLAEKLSIGYNGTVQFKKPVVGDGESWNGNALYLTYQAKPTVGLSYRAELINDDKLIQFGSKNIFANTLSLNLSAHGFSLIPEIRYDNAKTAIFKDKDGSAKKGAFSALIAAIYKF